jgi:archaeal type IV pilus assembly protein PilA
MDRVRLLTSNLRERKAISPIIATLLLILIAIAAGVVVYAYVIGFVGQSQTNVPVTETFAINAWTYDPSNGTLTFFVQNTGHNQINITQAYLYNSAGNLVTENLGLSSVVGSGSAVAIHWTGVTGLSTSSYYQVKATTANGNSEISQPQQA